MGRGNAQHIAFAGSAQNQRWPGKFGQWDKWKTCLRAAMVLRIRSEDDEANTAHA